MVVASPLRIVGQLHGRAYHPQAAARPRPEAYARFRNPGSLSVAENADRAQGVCRAGLAAAGADRRAVS